LFWIEKMSLAPPAGALYRVDLMIFFRYSAFNAINSNDAEATPSIT
jgi:hypothetical protein